MFITFRCLARCITHLCLGLLCLRCPAPACSVYLACPTCSACSTCPAVSGPTLFCLDAPSQACFSFSVWPPACLHVWDLASCLFCCFVCLPVCLLACMHACVPDCPPLFSCLYCLHALLALLVFLSCLLPACQLASFIYAEQCLLCPGGPGASTPIASGTEILLCNHSIL